MRTFHLHRTTDVSGVSGTGIVAEGVEFHDGQVVISWLGRFHTLETAPDLKTVLDVHGHDGTTTVVWDKEDDRNVTTII